MRKYSMKEVRKHTGLNRRQGYLPLDENRFENAVWERAIELQNLDKQKWCY